MSRQKSLLPPAMQIAVLLFLVGLLAEGFTYTWVRSECHMATRAIASEKILDQKLIKTRKRLNVELAHLKSPRNIAERAKAELGLRRPSPEQILRVNTEQ
jgi:uncharacterized membrane protein